MEAGRLAEEEDEEQSEAAGDWDRSGPWEAGGWAAAAAAAGALGLSGWLASATPRRGDWDLGGAAAAASVWKRCVPGWEYAKTGCGRLGAPS